MFFIPFVGKIKPPQNWGGNFRGTTQVTIKGHLDRYIGRDPSRLIIGHSRMESLTQFTDSHPMSALLKTVVRELPFIVLQTKFKLSLKSILISYEHLTKSIFCPLTEVNSFFFTFICHLPILTFY